MNDTLPPPTVFGVGDKFVEWRVNQEDAVHKILNAQKKFVVMACPTGFGKSLVYMVAGVLCGRIVVLTSTKGLQTQLGREFVDMGLTDVRGKNAYRCRATNDEVTCDMGPCNIGIPCTFKNGGCRYYDRVNRARSAHIVITNYHFFSYQKEYGEGIGVFDLLICDEAHSIPDVLSAVMSVEFHTTNQYEREVLSGVSISGIKKLKSWAAYQFRQTEKELENLKARINVKGDGDARLMRRMGQAVSALRKMKRITDIRDEENWIVDNKIDGLRICPIIPGRYANRILWSDGKKVLMTSATVRPKTVEMVGVEKDEYEFYEYPHSFPVENRQLIHIPTVRMNYRTNSEGMRVWLKRIDQILDSRRDRKGIVHTVSYARRNLIRDRSKHKKRLIVHDSRNAESAVRKFRDADNGAVLVSPSMATGYDFPYEECKYQIIGKLAYPDGRDPLVKARNKLDGEYTSYVAMQQLIQTVGRGVRSEDDWCENFMIDDNIQWFMKRYGKFAPKWFIDSVINRRTIPPPRAMHTRALCHN